MSGHEKVFNEDFVSVIEMDASEISVAECWYIATLRPYRNSEMQTTEAAKKIFRKNRRRNPMLKSLANVGDAQGGPVLFPWIAH